MNTREKIIVGIMTVVVIGGGIHFAMPEGSAKSTAAQKPDLTPLIAQVQAGLSQPELTPRERRALEIASKESQRKDPFRARLLPVFEEKPEVLPELVKLPVYTAFINVGARTLAIIDGHEYRKGASLTSGEYRVSKIFPDRVELIRQGAFDPVLIQLAEEL